MSRAMAAAVGLVLGIVLGAAMGIHAQSVEAPVYSGGFAALQAQIPDEMGLPQTWEFPNPDNDDTLQLTTTGLNYWSLEHWPTWTNGWLHVALGPRNQVVRWSGDALDPPPPVILPVISPLTAAPSSFGWPLGGAIGTRLFCIEGIESTHGAHMYNSTPVRNGEHAQGWLGFLPSTAAAWGAVIGNRLSEWAAAARMIANGAGAQFYGIAAGRC